jgi:uncharacterized protein YggE
MELNKAKTYFWILLDLFVAVAIINLMFFVMPAIKKYGNSLAPTRTMSVSAEGKTTVTPDLAQASFSVVSRGKNPTDLADMNNQKMSAVINFLKSEGLADKDIKTTAYNLSPDYQYEPKTGRSTITGYTLTQTVSVKMRDFKKVPEIIGGLTPLGINEIGGINFSVEDPEKFLVTARADAFGKAQAKAAEMAAGNGVRLGRIVNIMESQGTPPTPYYQAESRAGTMAAPAVAVPTIEPGSEELTDQVFLTYELE